MAVLSPCDAWAVGDYDPAQTLIVHWGGAAWTQVPSPNPGTQASLNAVSPVSASNVWAVGQYFDGTAYRTLIVHWDGAAWKQVTTPNPGGSAQNNDLDAVAVTPAGDAWAAGEFATGPTGMRTLVLHWTGSAWRREPTPSLGNSVISDSLTAVGGSPDGSVWTVGHYYNGTVEQTLAIHCC